MLGARLARVVLPKPVANLAPGPIDAELALAATEAGDFERLYALHRDAMAPALAALEGWDEAVRRPDFARLVARVPTFFIAAEDRICGYLQVLARTDVLHIVNVALAPGWRNAGRGARLFSALRGAAHTRRCGLHLKVYRSNPRALVFYRREGFVVTRCDERHWWLDWPSPG